MNERNIACCAGCGIRENIDLLDSKDDGTGNFTILECIACYGEDWAPSLSLESHPSIAPVLAPHYARYAAETKVRNAEHAARMIVLNAQWKIAAEARFQASRAAWIAQFGPGAFASA